MTKEEIKKSQISRATFFAGGLQGLRNQRQNRFEVLLLIAVVVMLTLIIVPKGGFIPSYYVPGDIATRDIKSPRDLLIEDVPLTIAKRAEAVANSPTVYGFDATAGIRTLEHIVAGLKVLNAPLARFADTPEEGLLLQLESEFGVVLSVNEYMALLNLSQYQNVAILTQDVLEWVLALPIVANLQKFKTDRDNGIVIVDNLAGAELPHQQFVETISLSDALQVVEDKLTQVPDATAYQQQILLQLVQQQLRPSLVFDQIATDRRQASAREQITPVLFQVKKGEMVVREGDRITADQILKLQSIRESGRDNRNLQTASGLIICTLLLFYVGFYFAKRNISKFCPDSRDLLFLAVVLISQFVMIKISIFIVAGVANTFAYIDSSAYLYAIPFALGAMLVRIVLNSEIAFVFSICCALLVGVLFGNNLLMVLYVLTASLVGAHGVRHCQRRTTLYRAGMWIGLVNVAMLIGLHFLSGRNLELQLLWKLGFGMFGGLASAIVVNGTIPLIESIFKYTTDIKLLEMANMNSPILRQLMIEAPGTYHHSILVGNLAEAAAEAVNANPLLTRVAAYYHDIGKIKKPLYFIENSGGQRNKHDKLAPSMSALILTSHVKDGADMAREHRLGSEIIDIIKQHHGTGLIKFFYERAKKQTEAEDRKVDERDYRYHGPKPQTREAALIMLADAVEAASRTLTDPTPARIQGMVQKLINNIFIDGQLDECDLTLKDINLIAKSFNRILAGSFHHRVDYPEPVHIVSEKNGNSETPVVKEKAKRKSANSDRKLAEATQDPEAAIAEDSPEDLKRLGIS